MAEAESVLLVDADATFTAQVREFLAQEGYAVTIAASGGAALGELGRGPIWLLLLNVALPDMDGLELVRAVRRLLVDPPEVIIVADAARRQTIAEPVSLVTAASLVKPLDLRRLGEIVRRVFERRQLTRENARLAGELAGRLRETEALLSVSNTISSTLDVREALRRVCRELSRVVGAEAAAAYLLDEATDCLVPVAGYHVPKEMIPTFLAEPLPLRAQGFHVPLFRERRPVLSDDVGRDPRFSHELFRRFPHQSAVLLPLILEDAVAGAFYLVWWKERRLLAERELALAEAAAGQVTVLLRNARLFEQADRERARLEALCDVARRLGAAHDPDEVLRLILNEATRLLGADAAGIRRLEGDDLVIAARTESAAAVMAKPRIKVGESLSGRVVATGEPMTVEDLVADTRYDPAHKSGAIEQGYHGFVGVPLQTRGRVTGALNLYTKTRRKFLPDEISLLVALADQASVAIDKAHMLRQAEQGRQMVERLNRLSMAMRQSWDPHERLRTFIQGIHDVVGFDRIYVMLVTADGDALEVVKANAGDCNPPRNLPLSPLAGPFYEAFQTRRPVAVLTDEDLATVSRLHPAVPEYSLLRSRRFVIVPLLAGDRVIGMVGADNKPSQRAISTASFEAFALICHQLASALEEARLYAETRAREAETMRLYEVATGLASSLDVERVLDLIVAKTIDTLDCDASGVYGFDPGGGGLRLLRGKNLDPELTAGLVLEPGEGVAGRAFRERQAVWTRDRLDDPSLQYTPTAARLVGARGPRAYLAVPIVCRGEVFGVLVDYYQEPHDFTPKEIQILSVLANHAAIALDNCRLFNETEAQRTRLGQIFDSTSDGVMLVNRAGIVEAVNRRAVELLDVAANQVQGQQLRALLTGPTRDGESTLHALESALDQSEQTVEGDLQLQQGKRILHWVAKPTATASGAMVGFTLTLQDVTQEREVSRMKSDFVSFVTHQLRTPLAGIKWILELAGEEPGLPREAASYIQDARTSANRLIGLVNDLLDVSRLERGRITIALEAVDLAELTRSVLDDIATVVAEKAHRLAVEGVDGVPAVRADVQLLRQVVLNLLSNAIKYTPRGGDVRIRMSQVGDSVRWEVQDSGIGIPKASQGRLFEKFYRADNVATVETEGTGLGLYLVRLIIEKLGGRVWCESEEARGSTFFFTLPLEKRAEGQRE
jgi:PAS domain S-box-containing protein